MRLYFTIHGMEFKAIYDIRDKVKLIIKEKGIKYTELRPKIPFLEKMLNVIVTKRNGERQYGYGLCGGLCRWGTTEKIATINKYLKKQYGKNGCRVYVGIAADEKRRFKTDITKCYPLRFWGMTEQECLEYCYNYGFEWRENGIRLYDIFDRASCWCCGNKNKRELDNMLTYLPNYYLDYIRLLKRIKESNKKNSIVVKKAKEQFIKLF